MFIKYQVIQANSTATTTPPTPVTAAARQTGCGHAYYYILHSRLINVRMHQYSISIFHTSGLHLYCTTITTLYNHCSIYPHMSGHSQLSTLCGVRAISECGWPKGQSDLFDYVGLHNHNVFHVTSDTRPSHFSRAMLKSWKWPGVAMLSPQPMQQRTVLHCSPCIYTVHYISAHALFFSANTSTHAHDCISWGVHEVIVTQKERGGRGGGSGP